MTPGDPLALVEVATRLDDAQWVLDQGGDANKKIRQKISGCLRTMTGAQAFCALRSYLDTARKQHQDALTILRQLHDGQPWLPDGVGVVVAAGAGSVATGSC